jgi:hypothetical protein
MKSPLGLAGVSLSGLGTAVPAWAQERSWEGWFPMCGAWDYGESE